MPIQIMPQEENWQQAFGTGVSKGLARLMDTAAQQKMQDYTLRNQYKVQQEANTAATKQKYDIYEQALGPGWGKLAYLPEKMGLMAIQGGWNPGMQQQPGIQQNMEALGPNQAIQQPASALQNPAATGNIGQAIGQGAYNTPQMIQARKLQEQQQAFTREQNELKRAAKAKTEEAANIQKTRKQDLEEAEKIAPFIKDQQASSSIIRDVGKDARRLKQILARHKKDWPNWVSGFIQGKAGGVFTFDPEMREFYKLTSALPVKLGNALKGQPTNMKIKLVAEGKPDIASPWETNMELVQHLIDADENDKKRTSFRIKQKRNGKNPVDLDQRMADYDAAINSPEEYPEFFEKYPQFRPKNMEEAPTKSAASEIKVGSKLDKLPPASENPGMEGLWNGKKVKSDGKSWRAA